MLSNLSRHRQKVGDPTILIAWQRRMQVAFVEELGEHRIANWRGSAPESIEVNLFQIHKVVDK
jgi:hypothetical protein